MGGAVQPNKPCPCGSGKKYKKCCLHKDLDGRQTSSSTSKKNSGGGKDGPWPHRRGGLPQAYNYVVMANLAHDQMMDIAALLDGNKPTAHGRQAEERRYNPLYETRLKEGTVAIVHSLQSERGQQLNEKRCVLLSFQKAEGRWSVQIQAEIQPTAVKVSNLKLPRPYPSYLHPSFQEMNEWQQKYPKLNFPASQNKKYQHARGVTFDDDEPYHRARKLTELLDRSTDYEPNPTIIHGTALKYYGKLSEGNMFADFVPSSYEHVSGLLALEDMASGNAPGCSGTRIGVEAVVFALLEAVPVSLDIVLSSLVISNYFGTEPSYTEAKQEEYRACRPSKYFDEWSLTPDQTNPDYILAMQGPLGLLYHISVTYRQDNNQDASSRLDRVFFERLEDHDLFSKTIHRLFRLVAREQQGTVDGVQLGPMARVVLANMGSLDDPLPESVYDLWTRQGYKPSFGPATVETFLDQGDVCSYIELNEFLRSIQEDAIDTVD